MTSVRTVSTTEVQLNVTERGDASHETLVLVHGWPDHHTVWDGVGELLDDGFHVVAYDVRGTGASSAPADPTGYQVRRLVDDLVAVVDAVRPDGRAVHLVGHDWGSVQLWEAVLGGDPRLAGRIASFTSISGPDLAMFGRFLRSRRHRAVLNQLVRSSYIAALRVPRLAELLVRQRGRDAVNGLGLYRQNAVGRALRTTDVPVLLLVVRDDPFVRPALLDEAELFAPRLTRGEVEGGHWVVAKHPERIAGPVRAFVEKVTSDRR